MSQNEVLIREVTAALAKTAGKLEEKQFLTEIRNRLLGGAEEVVVRGSDRQRINEILAKLGIRQVPASLIR